MSEGPQILVVAGEVSGDMHAAALVRALRRRRPDLRFFGVGGDHLRAEGMEVLYPVRDMAVMGFAEALRRLPFFRRVFRDLLEQARLRGPAAAILVDYPGFNLRFAPRVRALGVRTIYYVCPQVWAWNRSRIPRMARNLDLLITIFPFEAGHFQGTGLRVEYAGHPLVDETAAALARPEAPLPWGGEPRVALLPGSRRKQVATMLPILWRTAAELQRRHPQAGFIIPVPSPDVERVVRAELARLGTQGPTRWAVVAGQTREVLRQATAAAITSGTATMEACLMGCPMVVTYRTSWLNYGLCKVLVKVDLIGMVNIVAGEEVCPELIQAEATPARLAAAVDVLLTDREARERMVRRLLQVRATLGEGHAAERAADAVLAVLAGPAGTGA